ncbi:hypothetical protein [Uliginosibacterium sediminicola]|uniref:Uncharacterized protein n=1 Tax=Uliginosibacterium sediminicola TaxID=2024550 RepID=A0ABU9YT68_9RHOO
MKKLIVLAFVAMSKFANAESLAGMDYECREAKVNLKQMLENHVPDSIQGKERISWFEKNRTVSSRIKGRVNFNDGFGSADNGKLRLKAQGASFSDGLVLLQVGVEYVFKQTPSSQSVFRSTPSYALKGEEVGTVGFADAGEHDIDFLCSFTPVRK